MKLFYQENGVEISSDTGVEVADFLQRNPQFDFLNGYHLEEKILFEKDRIFISNEVISDFSPDQLTKLKLPQRYPHIFKCKSSGAILQDDYKITPIFKTKSGRPLGSFVCKGLFIKLHDKKYTLTHEIYTALQLIEKINATADYGHKLFLVQQLKILEIKISNHSSLEDISVSSASHFSLTVKDKDNFIVLPIFLKKEVKSNEDDELEYAELESTTEELLSHEYTEKYHEHFQSSAQVTSQTQVDDNKFLVLDNNVKKIMQVIKDAHTTKSSAARRALYACPNTYLRKEMGQQFSDELADAFIPDERYMSERISYIGEWLPKVQAFLPSSHSTWIPQNLLGIRLDNEIIYINPKNIPAAVKKMQQAHQSQQKTVTIDDQKVQVTPENIDLLTQASVDNEENASSAQQLKQDEDAPQVMLNRKTVAVIKDNIDYNYYYEDNIEREQHKKYIPRMLKATLHKHQTVGLEWLQESWNRGRRGVLLADDMGLGKTLQVLAFLAWLREATGENKPMLVVAPVALLDNWQAENNIHLFAPRLGQIVIGYGENIREIKRNYTSKGTIGYFDKSKFVLTTYDSLARNEDIFRSVAWQTIVFDECQYIKNPAAYRTDMAKAMAADFSIGVTGTPVENSLIDLWCIADAVHPGILNTCKNFKNCYLDQKNGYKKLYLDLTEKIIPPFLLRRTKDKHLKSLPEKQVYPREREMPVSQANAYNKVIEDIQKRTPDSMVYLLQAIRKMQTISLCPLPNYEADNDKDFIASSARLLLLFEILDEIKAREEKALIFIRDRRMQGKLSAVIQRRYTMADSPRIINGKITAKKRKRIVDDFQKLLHGFAVLIISPKAGGVGLTITNANNAIHLERWWNPAVEDQCSDRVYRIGQKRDVNIYIPIATHSRIKSHDVVLDELLKRKRNLSQEVIIPTTFDSNDYKDILRKTTGCDYHDFYQTEAWIIRRDETLAKYGKKCQKCGATPPVPIEVDHIKPRSHYPELQLDPDNLQVLCKQCNIEKSNKNNTNYRKAA